MEILSISSVPSHFTHEVESIHDHFSRRRVNEQLHYYQGLMDQHKRGVAISTLVDGQDKTRDVPPESASPARGPSSRLFSPTTIPSYVTDHSSPGPVSSISKAPVPRPSSGFDHQSPLPSFSNLDHDPATGSKLHEEILARHGQRETSAPSCTHEYGADANNRLMLPRLQMSQGGPGSTQHLPLPPPRPEQSTVNLSRQPSPIEPTQYQRQTASEFRFMKSPYPPSITGSPSASLSLSSDASFSRPAYVLQPYSSQPLSAESTRPLSDILEKTHAQIASQHQRNDSAIERASGHAPPSELVYLGPSQLPPQFEPPPNQLSPSNRHHHHSLIHPAVSQRQQHPSQPGYVPSPTSYHQYEHPVHGHHMPSSMASAGSTPHASSVAARKRRGNLPREAVRLFKKWVEENKRYPYPNEAQKQDFERMTGLSMQQINNWFINARRRNLSERERAEMKREKERQSQSNSPNSSRPDSSHGLPDPDMFNLDSLSGQASHSSEHSHGGSQSAREYQRFGGEN